MYKSQLCWFTFRSFPNRYGPRESLWTNIFGAVITTAKRYIYIYISRYNWLSRSQRSDSVCVVNETKDAVVCKGCRHASSSPLKPTANSSVPPANNSAVYQCTVRVLRNSRNNQLFFFVYDSAIRTECFIHFTCWFLEWKPTVLCEVGTESLYMEYRTLTFTVSQSVRVRFVVDKVSLGQFFSPITSVFSCYCRYTSDGHSSSLHVAVTRSTNGQSLGTLRRQCCSWNRGALDTKVLSLLSSQLVSVTAPDPPPPMGPFPPCPRAPRVPRERCQWAVLISCTGICGVRLQIWLTVFRMFSMC